MPALRIERRTYRLQGTISGSVSVAGRRACAPADEFTANWHIGTPRRRDRCCHLKIAEIEARIWTRHDLKVRPERRRKARPAPRYDEPVIRPSGPRGRDSPSHNR